jgi:hypothetical protein
MYVGEVVFLYVGFLTTLSVWRLYNLTDRMIIGCGVVGGMRTDWGNRNTRRNPVPMPLSLLKSHMISPGIEPFTAAV